LKNDVNVPTKSGNCNISENGFGFRERSPNKNINRLGFWRKHELFHRWDSDLKYRAGYLMSCAFGDLDMALALAPVIHIPLMVFGGFYLNSG
jgi:hypothetical protein